MRKKDEIPQEVINYCIEKEVSIEEAMIAVIDARLKKAEQDVAVFKNDVNNTINELNSEVTKEEMDDVESFLNFLNQQTQD